MQYTKMLLKLINEFSDVARYNINIQKLIEFLALAGVAQCLECQHANQKLIEFLHMSNEQLEIENFVTSYNSIKNMKDLGINATKNVNGLILKMTKHC